MADAYKLDKKKTWTNRIVRHEMVDPEELLAHPTNPRLHPKFQQDVMVGVLNQIGWVDDVIVNLRTNEAWGVDQNVETMLDGHLRVELALRKGEDLVPVKFVDLNPEEESLMLATFDPISALATIQADALNSVLESLDNNDLDVQTLLDQLAEQAGIGEIEAQEVNEELDAEAKVDLLEELQAKWNTATGQVWHLGHTLSCPKCFTVNGYTEPITQAIYEDDPGVLPVAEGEEEAPTEQTAGVINITEAAVVDWTCEKCGHEFSAAPRAKHIVVCGDSRDPLVFAYLMQDELADLVTTNPPQELKANEDDPDADNDNAGSVGLIDLLTDSLQNVWDYSKAGAVWYVCSPQGTKLHDFGTVLVNLGVWRQNLIWVKNDHVTGTNDFHYKHEPIFYGWKAGSAHHTPPDRQQVSVWELDQTDKTKLSPTMKPVELFDHMLQMSSDPDTVVLEPFSGSGTALMACERSGRRCRAIEIIPGMVAVTLERWSDATGQPPQLVASYILEDYKPLVHKTRDEERPILTKYDVPDALWAADNEFGIPLLDINMQADAADAPISKWGYYGRNKRVGTYHFYTEDYKFEALWKDPSVVLNSGAINVVEPNYSTNPQMPIAIVLYNIYRKRWIARWLQSKGVRIFVDLNVEPEFAEQNLIGVPKGWTAFFTRSIESFGLDALEVHYQQALAIANGKTPLFIVYGGGIGTRKFCMERGWLWVPENSHVMTGRFTGGVYDAERLANETDAGKNLSKKQQDELEIPA